MCIQKITKFIFIFLLVFAISCDSEKSESGESQNKNDSILTLPEPVSFDLEQIKERGSIIALVDNNSFSYFLHKGRAMGFEYELLELLADELKVDLEIKIVKDIGKMFEMLNEGKGDVIAHNLTVTKNRKDYVAFTDYLVLTKQVLIQKKPSNWRNMKVHEIKNSLIKSPITLIGKDVTVRKNSSFYKRLINLSDEIGGDINIIESAPNVETDELILQVANGEINYTVADKNVAQIFANEIPDIDANLELSTSQMIAWAVRKNSSSLLDYLNNFISRKKREATFNVLYRKYFHSINRKKFKDVFTYEDGKVSRYDEILKSAADSLGWDWLLVASIAYQESRFDANAESWTGAKGLMQIMPTTAKDMGYNAEILKNPTENLKIAVKYLKRLDKMWAKTIKDETQRTKFVLASYNVGPGHVIDARNLAKKYDKDPLVWDDHVELMLLKKAYKKYYTDEVVKHGYCRCYEPYNYVREIFARFKSYKQLTEGEEILEDSL